ncbi:MAG TPA: TolC family protein [Planctomycetota bacterium]|nr:TolC family protein [Planctomycetota bacterium]
MDAVRRPIVCLLAMAMLAGCAAYHARALDPTGAAATFRARTLHDASIADAFAEVGRPLPTATWTADDLWLVAQCCHPELVASRAEVAAAAAAIGEAQQWENPKVSLLPMRVLNSDPGVSPWILGGAIEFPLDLAGKRSAQVAIATAGHLRSLAVAGGTCWQLHAAAQAATCRCWHADADAALASAAADAHRRLAELLATRVRLGYAAPADLDVARAELTHAVVDAAFATGAAEEARAALAAAIGLPATALRGIVIAEPPAGAPEPTDRSVLARGDLQAAVADYTIADARLREAIAAQYPDVSLGPGYEFDQGLRKLQLGLSLTLPLWHANGAGVAHAEAERTASAARFEALQTAALQSQDAARAAATAAQRTLEATSAWSRDLETQAKRSATFADAGLGDRLAAIAAESALLDAQRAVLRSRRDATLAAIAWDLESGPPAPAAPPGEGGMEP